jgi:UDPglucose 6-dehydrogenase
MRIGIIGLGVVGSACKQGFELQGHTVLVHDIKLNTTIDTVLDTDVVYICVSTESLPDGSLDSKQVNDCVSLLESNNYQGIVAIKSTVLPGTTSFLNQASEMTICFVPEFLRERCAVEDFVTNHKLLVIGTSDQTAYDTVVKSHGSLPVHTKQLTETEAEIVKYYNNIFNAVRVIFSNIMYEVCEKNNANYKHIKDAYLLREVASPDYMDCNENLRGYGGMCLPKDVEVFKKYLQELNIDVDLFDALSSDNDKFKTTVFDGMRTNKYQANNQ